MDHIAPYRSFYPVPPSQIDDNRIPIVTHLFTLRQAVKDELRQMKPKFGLGAFGETVYYRTYSRQIKEFTQSGLEKKHKLEQEYRDYCQLANADISKCYHNPALLIAKIISLEKEFDKFVLGKLTKDIDYVERQEHWADTIIRTIEGCFSYRKDHMIKNGLAWNDDLYQEYARDMAISAFKMEWLPPGRGLWAGGTEYTYERGSASSNNCGMTCLRDLATDVVWAFDMLMCGCADRI